MCVEVLAVPQIWLPIIAFLLQEENCRDGGLGEKLFELNLS